jgi:undecaprenyl-diphosphatase
MRRRGEDQGSGDLLSAARGWVCRVDEAARGTCTASPATRTNPVAMLGRYAVKRHILLPGFALMWWQGSRLQRPRLRRAGAVGLTGLVGAALVNGAIKCSFPRGRPNECGSARDWGAGAEGRSFPSGHAGSAFAAATAIACTAGDPLVAGAALGCATMLSAGRVLRDRHWLSDVVIGAVIGTAVTALAARLIDDRLMDDGLPDAPPPSP